MKKWLSDFPTLAGGAVLGQALILLTGLIVCARLALGRPFPDGYESWLLLLFGLAGASVTGMIGKRLSDFRYKAAGTSPVTVEAPSNVTVETKPADGEAPKVTQVTAQPGAEPARSDDESGP